MRIDGRTRIYCLIGDPITHVRTPEIFNRRFAERGINAVVVPLHVSSGGLGEVIAAAREWKNLVGIGVTIPHKEAMTGFVDDLTQEARLCGATNVIRRDAGGTLTGTQMDGPGFVESLLASGFDPAGRRVLLSGAGGTARALAFSLADRGVAELGILNRTAGRAEALAADVRAAFPGSVADAVTRPAGRFDLLVNATSLGMKPGDALPFDRHLLLPGSTVADVVMSPPRTALLTAAEECGCRTHEGLRMLEAQFEATLKFLGLEPGRGRNVR